MVVLDPDRLARFRQTPLRSGKHATCDDGMCAVEAYHFLRAEPHSDDYPSAVIGSWMRSWNDSLPDDASREFMKPLIEDLAVANGSVVVTFEAEQARGLMAADWYCREFTPAWLELAGHVAEAKALRDFRPLASWDDVEAVEPLLRSAWSATWSAARSAAESAAESAARSAAWSAAELAAWSAARPAAWSATRSAAESAAESAARSAARSAAELAAWSAARPAARPAAWSATRSAARSAAELATWSAARSAARSAAESAAWSATWSAARSAAWSAAELAAWSAAWSAARSAAESAIRPTVDRLKSSAVALVRAMLVVA